MTSEEKSLMCYRCSKHHILSVAIGRNTLPQVGAMLSGITLADVGFPKPVLYCRAWVFVHAGIGQGSSWRLHVGPPNCLPAMRGHDRCLHRITSRTTEYVANITSAECLLVLEFSGAANYVPSSAAPLRRMRSHCTIIPCMNS